MGSTDTSASVQVVILNRVSHMRLASSSAGSVVYSSDYENELVDSYFEQYSVDNDCSISWSGLNLSELDGWKSIAGGSLFIRTTNPFNAFSPIREHRDDVDKLDDKSYVYRNGYKISTSRDYGIYHMVLPAYFRPTTIEYPLLGELLLMNARVIEHRGILTWVFKKHIQLKIAMKPEHYLSFDLSRETLFEKMATNLPENVLQRSKAKQSWAEKAVDVALSAIPSIFRVM